MTRKKSDDRREPPRLRAAGILVAEGPQVFRGAEEAARATPIHPGRPATLGEDAGLPVHAAAGLWVNQSGAEARAEVLRHALQRKALLVRGQRQEAPLETRPSGPLQASVGELLRAAKDLGARERLTCERPRETKARPRGASRVAGPLPRRRARPRSGESARLAVEAGASRRHFGKARRLAIRDLGQATPPENNLQEAHRSNKPKL